MNSMPGCWKPGNSFAAVVQRHQERLEQFARPALRREQMVRMPAPCAAATVSSPSPARISCAPPRPSSAPTRCMSAEGVTTERACQCHDRLEARRDPPGLEPAQHRAADSRPTRDIGQRKTLALAQAPGGAPEIDRGTCGAQRPKSAPSSPPGGPGARRAQVWASWPALRNRQIRLLHS